MRKIVSRLFVSSCIDYCITKILLKIIIAYENVVISKSMDKDILCLKLCLHSKPRPTCVFTDIEIMQFNVTAMYLCMYNMHMTVCVYLCIM